MKRKLKINWLGRCVVCGSENSIVETEFGSENFLFEKDKITCVGCGHQGLVVVENDVAYAIWHSVEAFRTYTQSEERD
ncbi:hypothetical protein OKT76_17465 [Providencia rettgeri]|uniref:hypothetical protein n=1 Tax=Providencia TaxID=586 RepID=UPI0018C804F4|nr:MULTISPECIES: hypothetical protein [Providencia]MBG5925302.1 hypothetical protein [Providencia rettgeri]MCX9097515.1 hypothetical protein [Providencia rettgeri]HCT9039552.1 hypothetical protein [Providencia rettgeri]HEM7189398.1 hypothetical protein [Providencia rettgeri]HEM8213031.1 hypothetical protein [Providencia rettgeri]